MTVKALVVTKGHPFDKGAFAALVDGLEGVETTHVEHPAARWFFHPDRARDYDVLLCYDMPGIRFEPDGPVFESPPEDFVAGFRALLDEGCGFVFLHHALAGWPAWDGFADLVGGRFLYLPGELRGEQRVDSGYRHGVTHTVRVLDRDHPVVEGVPEAFEITDELYLAEVFEDDVHPLLASDAEFVDSAFYSAALAVRDGRMFSNEGWSHPPGSNLIGWTRREGRSPICYLQCGDDLVAYANPHFARLLGNAVHWAAREAAAARAGRA